MIRRIWYIFLLMIVCAASVNAQTRADEDVIDQQMAFYRVKTAAPTLFVHLDKTVYVNNEVMWFTGYLLNIPTAQLPKHQVLAAALVNCTDQKVVANARFAITGNFAFGSLTVPDSIAPGNYSFIAYTNHLVNCQPDVLFKQGITIKTATTPAFDAEVWLDTLNKTPGQLNVTVRASSKTIPIGGAAITYQLGKIRKTMITGRGKTNGGGRFGLVIPNGGVTSAQRTLALQVKYNNEVKTLRLTLPVANTRADVKFYPEGGALVAGIVNHVGWEAKTMSGLPLKVKGVLYNGPDIVDTLETGSFGMGNFELLPVMGAAYHLKLLQAGADSTYTLPAPLNNGVALHVPEALCADTLLLTLQGTYNGTVTLLMHNYANVFINTRLSVSQRAGLIKVVLSKISRGLNTITLLDSLQRPIAERLFFAHYNQKPSVGINPGQPEYRTRQKVNLKLKLTGADGKPISGIVSVSCAQDSRFELKTENNIEHYFYLQSLIDNLPLKDHLMGNAELDKNYLNNLLLIRGWSRYKWTDLMQATAADAVLKEDSVTFEGMITHWSDDLKKPVQAVIMRDSAALQFLDSRKNGSIRLENEQVYTLPDKKVSMMISGKSDEYIINIPDPYKPYNTTMAQLVEPVLYEDALTQNTSNFSLKGFEHATHLKEVVIKASNKSSWFAVGANACGDYYCSFHILNCPNHINNPNNRPCVVGETYRIPNGPLIRYTGCADTYRPGMFSFTGIYAAKDFYLADYATINPSQPDYISTIFWKPRLFITPGKETALSFYTSDITGPYRIVVQGVTSGGVVYGEQTFNVKK